MLDSVRDLPKHFSTGAALVGQVGSTLRGPSPGRISILGMGGSAFPGNFLKAWLQERGIEVRISRDYAVPWQLDPDELVFVCSFSGNTEETLAAFDDACGRTDRIVAFTAGGLLLERARARGVAHVELLKPQPDFQPRAGAGLFFGAFLAVLENVGCLTDTATTLSSLRAWLESRGSIEERGRALAARIVDHIPLIYANEPLASSAGRAVKIKFNENAKIPAFFYPLPELNHNEMEGFTRPLARFVVVILRDPDLSSAMARRVRTTVAFLRSRELRVEVVDVEGSNLLEKMFGTMWLFDFVSCALAEQAGLDPLKIPMIEGFKRMLAEDP